MPLKYQVESLEGIPEAMHEHYTESGGVFVLGVEGVKPTAEFQKVMTSLEKERGEHKITRDSLKAFNGKTPADMLGLQTKVMELEAAGGGELSNERLDALLKQRLLPFEHEKTTLTNENEALRTENGEFKTKAINADRKDAVLGDIGGKVKPEFHKDLLYRAERELIWNPDLGAFVDSIGATAAEWAQRQLRDTPSWVVASNGSGASGGSGAPANTSNPFLPGPTHNLTEQGKILRADPKKAAILKAQAAAAK